MADNFERPTIIIGVSRQFSSQNKKLKPLLNGIEEEQIPVAIKNIPINNVISRAYQAALSSRLSVGIACEGNRYVVHYRNLPEEKPLFDYGIDSDEKLRNLGANAARLVKGIPFKKL